MKLVIFSDLHDNQLYLQKFLNWCGKNKIERILCCGDMTRLETLKALDATTPVPVEYIRGNADVFDNDDTKKFSNIIYLGRTAVVSYGGKTIALCHEPHYFPEVLKSKPDIIFYGHTHKPWLEDTEGVLTVNPGSLSGSPTLSTFAVWDTDKPVPELVKTDLVK